MSSSSTVLVTGATGGMGQAIVRRCTQDGYAVLATDLDPEALRQLTAPLPHAAAVAADLASPSLVESLKQALVRLDAETGRVVLHGIVNVAGVSRGDSIDRISDHDWEVSLAVNATAPMRLLRGLLPRLSPGGSVINVASPVALKGARKVSYSASKAALLGLTAAAARNLGPRGIRVNALLPGATITGMTRDWSESKRTRIAAESLLGRLCTPEDIAGAVSFLLGPDSAFITGSVLDVTGGAMLGAH